MITAVIVLFVVALALGGYIAFDVLHRARQIPIAGVPSDTAETQTAKADAPQSSEAPKPAPAPEVKNEPEITKAWQELAPKPEPAKAYEFVISPSEVREKVTAKEVDTLIKDEVAASLIEKSDGKTDRTKQAIINIDTLSQVFASGETVTLAEIKKRVKGFNKQTTYIKVLARGTLDKPLTVEADSFSLQAVKMIVLTGGTAVKKR